METMIIDVWADVVCPWCYIGKRRLEKAIAAHPHKENIQVNHRAFQLQPDAPNGVRTSDYLSQKYNLDQNQVDEMQDRVCTIADGEGLCYKLENTLVGNTFNAHRLLLWSAQFGKQDELLEKLFHNYFELEKPVFENIDLIDAAFEVGLDSDGARELLEGDGYSEEVKRERNTAAELGANGVPFFVFNMKYGISGAQPQEAFDETLKQAWNEFSSH